MVVYNWLDEPRPARGGDVLQFLWAMSEWEANIAQNGDEVRVERFEGGVIRVVGTLGVVGQGIKVGDEALDDIWSGKK